MDKRKMKRYREKRFKGDELFGLKNVKGINLYVRANLWNIYEVWRDDGRERESVVLCTMAYVVWNACSYYSAILICMGRHDARGQRRERVPVIDNTSH